jgi:glutaredoxin
MTRSVTAEESMCQETAMKLYDLKTGTNTRRVRIFLAEKGVKLSTVEVDMMKGENKNPDYLSKNPMGTMPLLELDDGTQLAESVAICRYIEELHPEPPPRSIRRSSWPPIRFQVTSKVYSTASNSSRPTPLTATLGRRRLLVSCVKP